MKTKTNIESRRGDASPLDRDLARVLRELLQRIEWLKSWRIEPAGRADDQRWDVLVSFSMPNGGVRGVFGGRIPSSDGAAAAHVALPRSRRRG